MPGVVIGVDAKCCAVKAIVVSVTPHFELQGDRTTASHAVRTDRGETLARIKNQVDKYVSNEVAECKIDVPYIHKELEHTL